MITIKTYGGLANRMRSLESAYNLAKKLKKPIHLIWEKTFELNCSFTSLFVLPNRLSYSEYSMGRKALFVKNRVIRVCSKFGLQLPFGYDLHLFNDDIKRLKKQKFNFAELIEHEKVYIKTVENFYIDASFTSIFQPVKKLQKSIDFYVNDFTENTIGIHVRRGDNVNAIKFSPISEFVKIMNNAIKNNGTTKFFLATDSLEVEKVIKANFGDKVLSHRKVYDRNSEKGIQDALIDMYCLANCKKIIGSHYSSFSEVASQIRNIELHQVFKKE